jgi:hypothetical protein
MVDDNNSEGRQRAEPGDVLLAAGTGQATGSGAAPEPPLLQGEPELLAWWKKEHEVLVELIEMRDCPCCNDDAGNHCHQRRCPRHCGQGRGAEVGLAVSPGPCRLAVYCADAQKWVRSRHHVGFDYGAGLISERLRAPAAFRLIGAFGRATRAAQLMRARRRILPADHHGARPRARSRAANARAVRRSGSGQLCPSHTAREG